jgi:hypothetical protein
VTHCAKYWHMVLTTDLVKNYKFYLRHLKYDYYSAKYRNKPKEKSLCMVISAVLLPLLCAWNK